MINWTELLESYVQDACVAEVSSHKPGNVSLKECFEKSSAPDFLLSAEVIAPVLARTSDHGVGGAIRRAVQVTRDAVGHNTNLGIILLLAPLARVPAEQTLPEGIEDVLCALTVEDAVQAYEGIQIAQPSGLGSAEKQDIHRLPTSDLRACMRLAADRDLIAAQYSDGFRDVLESGLSLLQSTQSWKTHVDCRLGWLAVNLIRQHGDSLVLRKCGPTTDERIRRMAAGVLESGWPHAAGSSTVFSEFDSFLRGDGHQRNPGTTADMIAAIVFAALRDGYCQMTSAGLEFWEPEHD